MFCICNIVLLQARACDKSNLLCQFHFNVFQFIVNGIFYSEYIVENHCYHHNLSGDLKMIYIYMYMVRKNCYIYMLIHA